MNWPEVQLSDLCYMNSGGTPRRGVAGYYEGDIRWAKIGDIDNAKNGVILTTDECITEKGLKSIGNRMFPKGTLLLAMYGSVGKTAIAGLDLSTNQAILGIRVKDPSRLDLMYLKFWFDYIKFKLEAKAVGGTLQNISLSKVKDLKVPLPPLPMQKEVVAILQKAEMLKGLGQEVVDCYDVLTQSVYKELFEREVDIVKVIPSVRLDSLSEIVSGVAKNSKAVQASYVEVPYMRVANVQDGHIDLREVKTIRVADSDLLKFALKPKDILLTEGGDPDKLGRGAIWEGQLTPCIHQNHIFRVRIQKGHVHPTFLSNQLGSRHGKKYFLKAAKQTTGIASINLGQLKAFPVHIPDYELQLEFADRVEQIKRQQILAIQQFDMAKNLYDCLIDQFFHKQIAPSSFKSREVLTL